ncbi:MGMT family protein [Sporosarcina thermotolerans]|uniref:MGMT family protein n=1 Tax=Sporosarcina thermotolerans TaxID=633404 RepID=A0AAW9A6T1_9BACL|nr:MGMT family protein [Sporosarcina thermotolerans]MDW0116645.1 MGMT family protein [Sporosarcina thermotolerans]
MLPFTERAVKIIKEIPAGRVMTYGQVASAAGNPRGARQISRILHSMSAKYELPWHRIINAQGGISTPTDGEEKGGLQRELLEGEGVEFMRNGKVDLTVYRWFPEEEFI